MKLINIIKQLTAQKHKISYRIDKDGHIRIQKIDNVSFTGSAGNVQARKILNVSLSERQIEHLEKIRTDKGKFGHKKLKTIDDELNKELRKVQRKWRKKGIKAGIPTKTNLREYLKEHTYQEAKEKLIQQSRYAEGLAYDGNIEALLNRITRDMDIIEDDEEWKSLNTLLRKIDNKRATLKDDTLMAIYAELYDYEKGNMDIHDLLEEVIGLLND